MKVSKSVIRKPEFSGFSSAFDLQVTSALSSLSLICLIYLMEKKLESNKLYHFFQGQNSTILIMRSKFAVGRGEDDQSQRQKEKPHKNKSLKNLPLSSLCI